jgi:hypothetical protein
MLYNQPLDQPTNSNAGYVDGNPAAGIQGSIVPAASIEFDQREIVEVITRANLRGYFDFSGTPCGTPSNSDLAQLRKAIEGYIQSWTITTNITKTVHGASPDFPDLYAAMAWLSQYRITNTGSVTFQVVGAASGVAARYTYNRLLTLNHPNIDRVVIKGTMIGGPVQGSDFQYTGNRVLDASAQLTMLRGRHGAELHFITGNFCAVNGCLGMGLSVPGLQSLLFTGDGTTINGYASGGLTFNNLFMQVGNLSIHGFGGDGFVTNNSYVGGSMDFFSSSGNGGGSYGGSGFELQGCALFASTQTISCSNVTHGFSCQGGTSIRYGTPYAKGNGQHGIFVFTGASALAGNGVFLNNGGWGIYTLQGQVYAPSSTFSGNASGPAQANWNGCIVVGGSTGLAGCSPAQGTQGNGFASIL